VKKKNKEREYDQLYKALDVIELCRIKRAPGHFKTISIRKKDAKKSIIFP